MTLFNGLQRLQRPVKAFSTSIVKQQSIGSSLWSLRSAPLPALALGSAGLIPFVSAPACLMQMSEFCPTVGQAQLAYGAVILSFLGGVRWGKLVTPGSPIQGSWSQFGWSVTPSLIAWPALLMPSYPLANLTVTLGLGLCGYMDFKQAGYEPWFKGLRIVLTTVATISLLASLTLYFMRGASRKEVEEVAETVQDDN